MQTEAELLANRVRIELETMERLISKGLPVSEAIQRECKTDESKAEAFRRYPKAKRSHHAR